MEGEEEGIREGRESYENSSHLSPPEKKKKKNVFHSLSFLPKQMGSVRWGVGGTKFVREIRVVNRL